MKKKVSVVCCVLYPCVVAAGFLVVFKMSIERAIFDHIAKNKQFLWNAFFLLTSTMKP